jgi:hypothetical protein
VPPWAEDSRPSGLAAQTGSLPGALTPTERPNSLAPATRFRPGANPLDRGRRPLHTSAQTAR